MNVPVDLLLTKVVDDLSPLTENIEWLHRIGYINNFKLAENQLVCIESSNSDHVRSDFKGKGQPLGSASGED